MKTPKQLQKQRIFLYLIIAAGIFYNLYLAFSDQEPHESGPVSHQEISNSSNLK